MNNKRKSGGLVLLTSAVLFLFQSAAAFAGQALLHFDTPGWAGYWVEPLYDRIGVNLGTNGYVYGVPPGSPIRNMPSSTNVLLLYINNSITGNVTNGFTGLSLYYVNGNPAPATLTVYSGLNGSGSALASVSMPTTPAPAYENWVIRTLAHSAAQSFVISGANPNYLAVDSIQLTGDFKPWVYYYPSLTQVGGSSITGVSTVNPEGTATGVAFEYALNSSFTGASTSSWTSAGSGSLDVQVTHSATGLARGVTYYVRTVATNAHGASVSGYNFFTIPQTAVSTLSASSVGLNSAVLNGSVTPNELTTGVFFQYSTNSGLAGASNTAVQLIGNGTNAVAVNAALTGLNSGNFYYRVLATNAAGTFNGSILSFSLGSGYAVSNGPAGTFTDISGTGTQVIAGGGIDDTPSASIGIGFNFRFFGAVKTNLFVNPNGLITFGGSSTAFNNFNLSVTSFGLDCIAVLWDDWITSGGVYAQTIGSPGQRVCLLQWNVLPVSGGGANTAVFQAQLYEDTGDIVLVYPDTATDLNGGSSGAASGGSATVGIQRTGAPANGAYLMWSFNSPVVASGATVRFTTQGPRITQQPANQVAALQSNAAFSVTASGATPFFYQWLFNGAAIAGGTNSSLTISNASFGSAGNYQVIVTNAYGSVTSSVAALAVLPTGIISWWQAEGNGNDSYGANHGGMKNGATFAAGKSGQAFSLDGTDDFVRVTNSASLILTNFTLEGWIKNNQTPGNYGFIWSKNATAAGYGDPFALAIGADGKAFGRVGNGAATEVVVVSDIAVNDNQWHHLALTFDGSTLKLWRDGNVVSFNGVPFTLISNATDAGIGWWYSQSSALAYKGLIDELTLYNRALTTNEIANRVGVSIITQPQSQVAVLTGNATFTATVSGTTPLAYQWYLNGSAIAGATNSSLTVSNASYATAGGNYFVIVTNAYGSVTSSVATLGVIEVLRNLAGTDGTNAYAGLVQAGDGNLYGTVANGGANGVGTLFKLTPGGAFSTMFAFTGTAGANAGAYPYGRLIQGSDGLLYGTTYGGGANSRGSIYKYSTNGTFTSWYPFTVASGSYVFAGLMQASDGNYYGTTWKSGATDQGTVYKITSGGTFTTLYSFNGTGGQQPHASLVQGLDGYLYGGTDYGGPGFASLDTGNGVVFKVNTSGAVSFANPVSAIGGTNIVAALTLGSDGNFYGGSYHGGANGYGVLFKCSTNGSFTQLLSLGGTNGANINGNLLLAPDGYFYGTTDNGGAHNKGTLFRLTPGGTLTPLLHFNGALGSHPKSGLLLASDGYLYGTTWDGGTNNGGVVYRTYVFTSPVVGTFTSNVVVNAGSNATLNVTAFGQGPFTYQWLFNGTNIAGATNGSLTVSNAGYLSQGHYTVMINNSYGSVTSVPAILNVIPFDPAFNGTGKAFTGIGFTDDNARAMVIQPDGKIVVAGYSAGAGNNDVSLARFNVNGTLDTPVQINFGGEEVIYGVALQPDGKILAAGYQTLAGNDDFLLVRFLPNGNLDGTFGSGGKVTTPVGSGSDIGRAVAVQLDGKIVVAGQYHSGASIDFAVVRFNTNGTVDTSFGTSGKATTDFFGIGDDVGTSVALQTNGMIVVAGYANAGGGKYALALARYTTNGVLDSAFDGDGMATGPQAIGSEFGLGVALQPDGKILVAGRSGNGANEDFVVDRFNPNGSMDGSFNSTGKLTVGVGSGNDSAQSVALQPDGKILLGGYAHNGSNYDFAIVRLNTNGGLDATFGGAGVLSFPIGSGDDTANTVALEPDGKIVLAGTYFNGANNDFAVARLGISPSIVTPPQSLAVECGSVTNLSALASGYPTPTYQWQRGGTNLPSATNSSYAFTASPAAAGAYAVVAANSFGSFTSSVATVTVRDTTPPLILSTPAGQTNSANSNGLFVLPDFRPLVVATDCGGAVTVGQSPAPGTLIGLGSTLVTLTATDPSNNVASTNLIVAVIDTTPPTINCGQNEFLVYGLGWDFTVPIVLDNSGVAPTLIIQSTTTNGVCANAMVATRVWRATDGAGNFTLCTQVVTVYDNSPPVVLAAPTNRTLVANSNCQAVVPDLRSEFVVTNCHGVTLQQSPLPGTLVGLGTATITVTANGTYGGTTNRTVLFTVQGTSDPVFVLNFTNLTLTRDTNCLATMPDVTGTNYVQALPTCAGAAVVTQSIAVGTVLLPGVHPVVLGAADSLGHAAYVTNTITVLDLPLVITVQPQGGVLVVGSTTNLTVAATACPPLSYQWFKDGGSLPGATNSVYSILSVMPGDAGSYVAVVTGAGGSVTSAVAVLYVGTVPTGSNLPPSLVFGAGGTTLQIEASGTGPLSYQWLLNGTNVPGATNASYTIPGTPGAAGNYSVVVSNPYGSFTSGLVAASFFGDLKFFAGTVLAGPVGSAYRVDYADALTPTNWLVLTNLTLPSSPYLLIDPNSPGQGQRFYRAVPVP